MVVACQQMVDRGRRPRGVERAALVRDREQRHAAGVQQRPDLVQEADRLGDVLEDVAQDDVVEADRDLLRQRPLARQHPGDRRDGLDRGLEQRGELGSTSHVGDVAAADAGPHDREVERAQLEAVGRARDRPARAAPRGARRGSRRARSGARPRSRLRPRAPRRRSAGLLHHIAQRLLRRPALLSRVRALAAAANLGSAPQDRMPARGKTSFALGDDETVPARHARYRAGRRRGTQPARTLRRGAARRGRRDRRAGEPAVAAPRRVGDLRRQVRLREALRAQPGRAGGAHPAARHRVRYRVARRSRRWRVRLPDRLPPARARARPDPCPAGVASRPEARRPRALHRARRAPLLRPRPAAHQPRAPAVGLCQRRYRAEAALGPRPRRRVQPQHARLARRRQRRRARRADPPRQLRHALPRVDVRVVARPAHRP